LSPILTLRLETFIRSLCQLLMLNSIIPKYSLIITFSGTMLDENIRLMKNLDISVTLRDYL
jgi:hypothetical protein